MVHRRSPVELAFGSAPRAARKSEATSEWPRTFLGALRKEPNRKLELVEAPPAAFSEALQLVALEVDASIEARSWSFGEVVARKRLSRALREVAVTAAHTSADVRAAIVGALLEHANRALSQESPSDLTPLAGTWRAPECPSESGVRARAEPAAEASPTDDDDIVTAVIARPGYPSCRHGGLRFGS